MNREEIIRNLKYTMEKHKNDTVNTFDTNISAMCKDILDYLEQEPCVNPQPSKDCVDRHSVELLTYRYLKEATDNHVAFYEELLDLPPVTPQPKTGHWIFDEILDKHYYCSECKSMGVDYWDFCPNCGAKMVEPQESEG